MKKGPVFLGEYSKIEPAGSDNSKTHRRWHVWSLDSGQFLIQEIFPDRGTTGEPQRIDSSEFFGKYRVYASFSSDVKGRSPQMPEAGSERQKAAQVPPPDKSIFDGPERDKGIYPSRGKTKKEETAKDATFYVPKDVRDEKAKPLATDLEKLEEQLRSDFSLALIRLQTDRDKALESLNRIVANNAKFEKKHKFMFSDFGTALRRRRLYSLAFRFHERAKELSPDDEHILFNMARAMFDAGKVEHALKYLRQAVAMSRDFQAGTDFLEFIENKYSRRL